MGKWNKYYDLCSQCPSPWVKDAVTRFTGVRRHAVDLGAGTLRHTAYLRQQGFLSVIAVDISPRVHDFAERLGDTNIHARELDIRDYTPAPGSIDFCVSINTLWFIPRKDALAVIGAVHTGLRDGGFFALNLMGPKDDWVKRGKKGISTFTREETKLLHPGFEIVHFEENQKYEPPAGSTVVKLWHQWFILLRKKGAEH